MLSTVSYKFEEAAGFSSDQFRAGLFNGVAEVSYAENHEWFVSAISLECDNRKCGDAAQSKMVPLSRAYDGPIFEAIAQHLEKFERDHIQEMVNEAIDEHTAGEFRRPVSRLALAAAE